MAASYSVEGEPGLAVVAMWSQPYDLNLHSAYTAAGVTRNRARYAVILYLPFDIDTHHSSINKRK